MDLNLREMSQSEDATDRLRCLHHIRSCLAEDDSSLHDDYFQIASQLVSDVNNDCRWQSIIVLSEYIASRPLDLWELIVEKGVSADDDMIDALATVLLEHLIDQHFDLVFDRVRDRVVNGDANVGKMLLRCWRLSQSDFDWRRIDELKNEVRCQFGLA